jgi:phosphate:Na+ symporter
VLRDLKRIHSHICSVAYPVLDAPGQLRSSVAADAEPVPDALKNSAGMARGQS